MPNFFLDHADQIAALFAALNLAHPGLEPVKQAADAKDWPRACAALVEYYEKAPSGAWLRIPSVKPGTATVAAVEAMRTQDTFTFQDVTGRIPRTKTGGLDWNDRGPRADNEWTIFLNRFFYLRDFLAAYRETGNPAYPAAVNALVRDWIASNPQPPNPDEAKWSWHVLQVGLRLITWPTAFYGFQGAPEFTPETRILMLASLAEQAAYVAKNHWVHHNHATMELCGLATTALAFPEFKDSAKWFEHAKAGLIAEAKFQTYPDGVQNELTAHYHWVSMKYFQDFADTCTAAGQPVPPELHAILEKLHDYLALTISPTGHNLLNNNSDRKDHRPILLGAAEKYARPDWLYAATNGAKGTRPNDPPSRFFPWAGQLLMRDDWGADAQFAFFDVGPWGNSHQHNDKLHLSVAFGRDLLVDTGRWRYESDAFRYHFNLSAGHNVILLDGQGQNATELLAKEPQQGTSRIEPAYDLAVGRYDAGFGDEWHGDANAKKPDSKNLPGTHTRAVLYVRGRYWVVVDHVTSDAPREMTALWHFAPDVTAVAEGTEVRTTDKGQGNLRILPVGAKKWSVAIVKGQTEPEVQGWFSERYNEKTPAPCAVYRAPLGGAATFAWVLQPFRDQPAPISAKVLPVGADGAWSVEIREPDREPVTLTLRPGEPTLARTQVTGL